MCQEIDRSIKKCDAKYKIYMEYLTGEKPYHDNTEEIQPKPPGEKSYNPTNGEKTYDHTGKKPYLICSELDINSAKMIIKILDRNCTKVLEINAPKNGINY